MVASDGGVFAFGDAHFRGSLAGVRLNSNIVGIAAAPAGTGYWLVAANGRVFPFGNASYSGSVARPPVNQRIVGISRAKRGYWLVSDAGRVMAFGTTRPRVTTTRTGAVAIATTPPPR
jgi:hypothetical protein